MKLDMDQLARMIGMLVLEKMSAEAEVRELRTQLGGEANGQDLQGEGNQGA